MIRSPLDDDNQCYIFIIPSKIKTIASGPLQSSGGGSKFFLYAQEQDDYLLGGEGPKYLALMSCLSPTGEVQVQVRTTHISASRASEAFLDVLFSQLARSLGALK